MLFKNVSIMGMSHLDAPNVVTSEFLESKLSIVLERLNLRKNIIEGLTGIKSRRFWDQGVMPSEVATLAGVRALENARLDKSQLGVIVNTSVSKDYIEPSVAAMVHGNLKLEPECLNFDIGNACLAFLNAIQVIGNMIDLGQIKYGLIVNGESSKFITENTIETLIKTSCDEQTFKSNFATLTLGSGAAAMVLAHSDLAPDGHKVVGCVSLSDTENSNLCLGQVDKMTTNAAKLLVSGIELVKRTHEKAIKELNWGEKQINEYILHQVSENHTKKVTQALNVSLEKVYTIYPEFGNIGPAAIPIALSKSNEAGRISKGDRVALMGIGSGINCSMMEILW
ncbi:MAG: 3-oxoacyl-ACP synthase III [Candidatus Sericytochromatia bacterium]|nr:3-oxoacyl-ACP synthase III [Candidatus Sericytochromatia bacterium]